jgi:hypothetical protein
MVHLHKPSLYFTLTQYQLHKLKKDCRTATCPQHARNCGLRVTTTYFSFLALYQIVLLNSSSVLPLNTTFVLILFVCLFLALQPNADHGCLMLEGFRSHTFTHHSRYDSSGRGNAHCRDVYLTTYNTHKRQTSMPLAGFKPAIQASVRQ